MFGAAAALWLGACSSMTSQEKAVNENREERRAERHGRHYY